MSDTHQTDVKTHDTSDHPLFTPLKVGNVLLQHLIVMAPMTRYRADDDHIPTDMMTLYYSQELVLQELCSLLKGLSSPLAPEAMITHQVSGIKSK